MITQERLKELFDYHPSGNLVWRVRKSQRSKVGKVAGFNSPRYRYVVIDQKHYPVHRLIFLWHFGFRPEQIDHINRNGFDNRIENLRPATAGQNQQNKRLHKNNTSGFKGVSWREDDKKWYVRIACDKKEYYLGRYGSLLDAAAASISARKKLHGEFARIA